MNRFLISLMILSILVMAQSVVAITPSPISSQEIEAVAAVSAVVASQPEVAAMGGLPEPFTLLLLLTGLSGLTVAGNRPARERTAARS